MPPRYEKWLPKFTGSDEKNVEDHMRDFFSFFQLHPVSDDVEDLAMKLFSNTLHDNAKRWYDGLPDASITSMDQLEEVFLKRWNIKEDEQSFVPEVKISEPKDTLDIPKRTLFLETSVEELLKGLEQYIDQQEGEEKDLDEVTNPMEKNMNLLMLLAKIMRT
jgi:hypothetical protein